MKAMECQEFIESFQMSTKKKILLDVRTKEETSAGRITQATLIPLQELESNIAQLSKDAEIYVYCKSGKRAQSAGFVLEEKGFKHVIVAVECGYEELKSAI